MTGPDLALPPGFVARVTGAFGVEGARWIDTLPALLADLTAEWAIEIGQPFELSYGYVAAARTRTGTEVVLKAVFPNEETRRQIAALQLYAGAGACRLLAANETRGAMLLDRVQPGGTLEALAEQDDEAATRIGASVMRALWQPVSEPSTFLPLETWFEAFPRYRATHGVSGPLLAVVITQAEALARDLLASSTHRILLHGDLHHGNILDAGEGRRLAIDPKGVAGDCGYEVGPFLLNPLGIALDARLLSHRLDVLAETLAYDRERLRDWGVAHAVLSACWSIEDHNDGWERAVHAATLLGKL